MCPDTVAAWVYRVETRCQDKLIRQNPQKGCARHDDNGPGRSVRSPGVGVYRARFAAAYLRLGGKPIATQHRTILAAERSPPTWNRLLKNVIR